MSPCPQLAQPPILGLYGKSDFTTIRHHWVSPLSFGCVVVLT